MTFRRGARLNPGQVRDVRGSSGRRAACPAAALAAAYRRPRRRRAADPRRRRHRRHHRPACDRRSLVFLNGGLGAARRRRAGAASTDPGSTDLASCQTGADANARQDCRIVGYVNSIQAYWTASSPRAAQHTRRRRRSLFTDYLDTPAAPATADTGPFYCPPDKNVYLDLGFFDVLESQYGGSAAPLAQAYVLAHEYGHHVQDLEGTLARSSRRRTPDPTARGFASSCRPTATPASGRPTPSTRATSSRSPSQQINDALSAAAAVGDDRIQQQATGRVNPETWTHGSSEQRQNWFSIGYRDGDPGACDTFNANPL